MKYLKYLMLTIIIGITLCLALMLGCDFLVTQHAKGKIYDDVETIPYREVGLLLGTTPQTRIGGYINRFFVFRINAAEKLFKAGKVSKILISGDEDSLDGVNEVVSMRDSLIVRGVPAEAILLDGKGFRTIVSVERANKVFGLNTFTIITQQFHNERAIYQADHLGLGLEDIIAYNAESPRSAMALLIYAREYLARVKMFWDLVTLNINML